MLRNSQCIRVYSCSIKALCTEIEAQNEQHNADTEEHECTDPVPFRHPYLFL